MHITSFTKTLGTLITPPAARMAFDADFDLVALERPEKKGCGEPESLKICDLHPWNKEMLSSSSFF